MYQGDACLGKYTCTLSVLMMPVWNVHMQDIRVQQRWLDTETHDQGYTCASSVASAIVHPQRMFVCTCAIVWTGFTEEMHERLPVHRSRETWTGPRQIWNMGSVLRELSYRRVHTQMIERRTRLLWIGLSIERMQ